MRYKLIIFDFDGTLADSRDWFAGVINQVAARYRFRQVSRAELEMLRGYDNRAIIRYLGVPGWKLPLIANHMRRLVAHEAHAIPLFPGVGDLLDALASRGVALAVVTSNSEENVRRILGPDNAAAITYFACGASLFGKAAKFRQVLRRAGVAPADALCIGDETRDVEAAAAVGLAAGAVTWGYATAESLRACRPTLTFESLDEIAALAN
jgi:phosphoglycolate phosphatase